ASAVVVQPSLVGASQMRAAAFFLFGAVVDHPVKALTRQIHHADQLGGKLALVDRLLLLEDLPITRVEFGGGDRVATDLGDGLIRQGTARRASPGEEDEADDKNDDDGKERPLELVEAFAHDLEHPGPPIRERGTIAEPRT